MADRSKIEWTDATWNPITGCSVVSPGCTNCYAMRLAGGRMQHHPSRAGLTEPSKAGPVWNGQVRFNETWLGQPIRWKASRMIFVCAHGDLFHEHVPDEWIDRVFAVMAMARQHRFQVLTKRADRMRRYLTDRNLCERLEQLIDVRFEGRVVSWPWAHTKDERWPLRNVWLGVSVEDQQRAEERIPLLLDTPAAVRFVSAEPLLGPINLSYVGSGYGFYDALRGAFYMDRNPDMTGRMKPVERLDWVIAGGESGAGARPMHPDWPRALRDQCVAAGVAFHFKQWGEWAPGTVILDREGSLDGRNTPFHKWDEGRRVSYRVGKRRAGRELDGRTWDEMPT